MAISELRAFGKPFIPQLVRQGLSSGRIISTLKQHGVSYRRTDMLKDIREVTGLARMESFTRAADPRKAFPKFGMIETTLRKDRRYRVFGKLEYRDTLTGETFMKDVSFYTDTNKGKELWDDDFLDQYEMGEYKPAMYVTDFTIVNVEHQTGWSY